MMRRGKKNIVLLALSLVLLGNTIAPMNVSAAEPDASTTTSVVEDRVVYEEFSADVLQQCFGVQAPTPSEHEGYYFGGWYLSASDKSAIKYQSQVEEAVNNNTKVYAKFVSPHMLNVKVQNLSSLQTITKENGEIWATAPNNKTNIRMISAIDSTRYGEVGFHLFVSGNRSWANPSSKYNRTVYSTIKEVKNGNVNTYTVEKMFGIDAKNYDPKFIMANFNNIPEQGWKSSIYVRPYWVTFDGIEVRGIGRYIHIEDGIKGYITVPINLQGLNSSAEGIAAGTLDVKYDWTKLTYIDTIDGNTDAAYKAGADLKKVAVKQSTLDTSTNLRKIKCAAIREKDAGTGKLENINPNEYAAKGRAGSTTSDAYKKSAANYYENVNNMYVTLRFEPKEAYKNAAQREILEFDVSNTYFCDAKEQEVTVDVWDVRY